MQQKSIIIDNLKISYLASDQLNQKKVLVFLHGWQSEASHLKPIFQQCQNFVALDLPGFGQSEQPKSVWSIQNYAEFLTKFLAKLGIINPILVGHSFGGSIIIKYCAQGNLAKKIILIDAAGVRNQSWRITGYKYLAKILKLFLTIPGISHFKETIRQKAYKAIDSEDYVHAGSMREIYRQTIKEDLQADMKKNSIPTVLIWGQNDSATPLENAQLMVKKMQQARLLVIEKAGHFPFIDQPEKFNQIFFTEINAN